MLPTDLPTISVVDSNIVRGKYLALRDKTSITERMKIRRTLSGISKCESVCLKNNIDRWTPFESSCQAMNIMLEELHEFVNIHVNGPWREEYDDKHSFRAMIGVDSHQLNPDSSKATRYKSITPCLFVVLANQLADNVASIGVGKIESVLYNSLTKPQDVLVPPNGQRFYLTHNGRRLDKDYPKEVWDILSTEMERSQDTSRRKVSLLVHIRMPISTINWSDRNRQVTSMPTSPRNTV